MCMCMCMCVWCVCVKVKRTEYSTDDGAGVIGWGTDNILAEVAIESAVAFALVVDTLTLIRAYLSVRETTVKTENLFNLILAR